MKERQALYNRAYQLAQEVITLQADLKELAGEFTYDKEYNVEGFDKAEVKDLIKAATAKAKDDDLQAKAAEFTKLQELQDLYSK